MTTLATLTPADVLFGKRIAALYTTAVAAIGPIFGFGVPDIATKTVPIIYQPSATQPQKDQVAAIIATWLWTQAAQDAYEDSLQPDLTTLRNAAQAAMDNNDLYHAGMPHVAADALPQVDKLGQQNTQIIKTLLAVVVRLTGH